MSFVDTLHGSARRLKSPAVRFGKYALFGVLLISGCMQSETEQASMQSSGATTSVSQASDTGSENGTNSANNSANTGDQPTVVVGTPSSSSESSDPAVGVDPRPPKDDINNDPKPPVVPPVVELPQPTIKAGFGVVDMTPDVGYCAGQYCDTGESRLSSLSGEPYDPFLAGKAKKASHGVQSRLTARALVIEGNNGKRIALLKSDNYLAQDQLIRRVATLLKNAQSKVGYDNILYHVTHNHSSSYSSTLAVGVWVFQDAYDARFFENQARQLAKAILMAEANLKPARVGATTVTHRVFKGNVVRPAVADDGTPAGYPTEFGDHGVVVMRVEDLSDRKRPKLMGSWVNHGQHPESLDAYDLHSADFLGPLERMIERETGGPLVFSQGDVGSSESTGNSSEMINDAGEVCGQWVGGQPNPDFSNCGFGQGVVRDSAHKGYAQMERNVRYLADDIIKGLKQLETGGGQVPMSGDLKVDALSRWVPGPLSHPLPSVSNCNTARTADGNPGAPALGLPDCARGGDYSLQAPAEFGTRARMAYDLLKAEGVPVPDSYSATSYNVVEENARIRLQVFQIGDVVLASCACEAQVDLILNLESRLNAVKSDIFSGFDWACLMDGFKDDPKFKDACVLQKSYFDPADPLNKTVIPGTNRTPAAIARMRAQVHNDARGWDLPENAYKANSESPDVNTLWGNFTREEIQDRAAPGFKLAVGVGHAGDYNGYTVSYREFRSRDSYRKALTAYGPHTADYMVTRLVRMAAALQGGKAIEDEPHQQFVQIDEAKAEVANQLLSNVASAAYDQWLANAPSGSGALQITVQPQSITRFQAATVSWRGGSTAVDNPRVTVERKNANGQFEAVADQTGEIATRVQFPSGLQGLVTTWVGQQEWIWSARFEAYSGFPSRLANTLTGEYRFCIAGRSRQSEGLKGYTFCSNAFTVQPWQGLAVSELKVMGDRVEFKVPAIVYPERAPSNLFDFLSQPAGDTRFCKTCSFGPWAKKGQLASAQVIVQEQSKERAILAQCNAGVCSVDIKKGKPLRVEVADTFGNTGVLAITP